MEVLSASQIISLATNESETLNLPSEKKIPIIPFKKENSGTNIGALFQKICSTCQAPSKYQCPKCSSLSCSVECVKAHKLAKDCDGKREINTFITKEEFNDAYLHSDFHFLEDIHRNIDIAKRGKKGKGLMDGFLPCHLTRLQMAARLRTTDLHILPAVFSKRKRSTTFFRYKDKKIFWRLEWEFPHIEVSCVDERVDEDTALGDCLDKYINEQSEYSNENFSYYHSLQSPEIAVLMKDENCASNETQYHLLELRKTLKSNFRHKKIIEYPSLLVVNKLHLSCYQIVV